MGSFTLYLVSSGHEFYPISSRILRYFEEFVYNNILIPKKIIIHSKWDIGLFYMFAGEGRYAIRHTKLYPYQHTGNSNKDYPISLVLKDILIAENKSLKVAQLIFEGIVLYFTSNFKKTSIEFMENLKSDINWDYLASLPYPAHLKDIDYVGENYMSLSKKMGW